MGEATSVPRLRPIKTDGFAAIAAAQNLGASPDLRWIAIAQLVVDDAYQRPLTTQASRANIRRIAEAFDWRRFAPVVVSPVVGGRFAIIDGQHRATAAALCAIEEVPCAVVIADRVAQAEAFAAINGVVTRVKPAHLFKAHLAAGEPQATMLDTVCRGAGIEVMRYHASGTALKPGQTSAVGTLYRLLDTCGPELLGRCLAALMESVRDQEGALKSTIIRAAVSVLSDHRQWLDDPRLGDALAAIDLVTAEEDARQGSARRFGVTTVSYLQATLISHLDKHLPERGSRAAAAA